MTAVLVVEDSPTQAQELAILLESEGFDVEVARDGLAGLERCKQHSFDVVLLVISSSNRRRSRSYRNSCS